MRTHLERFGRDLKDVAKWISFSVACFLAISAATTYMMVFAAAGIRDGTLSRIDPLAEVAFLRSLDPEEAIVQNARSTSGVGDSSIEALLAAIESSDDLYLTLPMSALIDDQLARVQGAVAPTGLVVVGPAPFLGAYPTGDFGMLWGDLDPSGQPVVDDTHIGPVTLQRVDRSAPAVEYITGDGRLVSLDDTPIVALTVDQLRAVGISSYQRMSEIVASATCSCTPDELSVLTAAMTARARDAGSRTVYYAVDLNGVVGPIQRASALSEVLDVVQGLCAMLAVAGLAPMSGKVLWQRRSRVFAIEILCGSREEAIQLRFQALLACAVTAPLLLGFGAVNALMSGLAWPPPLGGGDVLAVGAATILLHAALSTPTYFRIHRLSRQPLEGGSRG